MMAVQEQQSLNSLWRTEWVLAVSIPVTILFLTASKYLLGDLSNQLWYDFLFVVLFLVILLSAFSVVRHADALAKLLGEPYGTLILTLAVIGIEVIMIAGVMLTGANNPTLARDTMFSVLMIVLNLMVGASILLGGLRHYEQSYNLRGANAYMGVLLPLSLLGLVLPRLTGSAPGGQVSMVLGAYLIGASILLYLVFLGIQTIRHRDFFKPPQSAEGTTPGVSDHRRPVRSVSVHAIFLVITMIPIVLLSSSMAKLIDHGLEVLHAPVAIGGFFVAVLVLTPEGLSAFQASRADRLQRSINICLGSALSTIGLTIPCVLAIAMYTGTSVVLGLEPVDIFLLVLTLAVSMITFGSGRTNVLQGVVHLLLFATYVALIFD